MKPLARIPVAALLVIAGMQVVMASHGHLVPWKAGGFGMFSTTDDPGVRRVMATGVTLEGDSVRLLLGSVVSPQRLLRIRLAPTPHLLEKLGTTLLREHWVPSPASGHGPQDWRPAGETDGGGLVPRARIAAVHVYVTTASFEHQTGSLRRVRVLGVTMP